ncbi:MAG: sulfotransferase, partial [Anaerolineales bacterium]
MHKYDLDFQRELRWLSQKPIVRNIGEYPPLRRLFSSRFALVVGSQRSGTTLMFLMLTAHPRITGLDEHHAEFALPRWPVIAVNAALGKRTLYKLPMATGSVAEICRNFPKSQLIWMLRHPFAVVASMRK